MELFAKNVKERAAALKLSQAEVARRVGITERRFGHYLSSRSEPNQQVLIKIAAVLDSKRPPRTTAVARDESAVAA